MRGVGPEKEIAERYRRFAEIEARGRSAIYEQLAQSVARSKMLLGFLRTLPPERQQPNLFFAAVKSLSGVPQDLDALESTVDSDGERLRHVMLTRTTQTNEAARCATLLPFLSRLPQPLALIEVGASAGLCLLPDRYAYDYGTVRLEPREGVEAGAPVFRCVVNSPVFLPATLPEICWRAGLDLNPLDVWSDADMGWLEALIWPDQHERIANLRAAIAVARKSPPRVMTGDLVNSLPALVAEAPSQATLVVFHSAVLSYIADRARREQFIDLVRSLNCVWISNEAPRVLPDLQLPSCKPPQPGMFSLAVDGTFAAWTDPHGQRLDWAE